MAKKKTGKGGGPRWEPKGGREVKAMSPDELAEYAMDGVVYYERLQRKAERMKKETEERMAMEVGRSVLRAVPWLAEDPKKAGAVVSSLMEFASANRGAFDEWKVATGRMAGRRED